ncbi:nickel insertion protein [Proteiniclasticum sp. C24MP]|uniref:nickel insertion protein n=1 Tax=Proteiniclasticum sp. C24MP TaxID=3374101 RepID=UPI0037540A2D
MSTLYIDGSRGMSGNTLTGAFISLGLEPDRLREAINAVINENEYELIIKKYDSKGRKFIYFNTKASEKGKKTDLSSAADVLEKIRESALEESIKENVTGILSSLFRSKAEAHEISLGQVEFRYEGMIDTIIDAVGASLGLNHFNIDKVWVSSLNTGRGTIKLPHKNIDIPAPMTRILLKNHPTFQNNMDGELVTPTGAAIIRKVAAYHQNIHMEAPLKIGYGLPKDKLDEDKAVQIAVCE